MPTPDQTRPRAIYEPGEAPKWGVTSTKDDSISSPGQSHASLSSLDESVHRSPSASLKRSSEEDAIQSSKKRIKHFCETTEIDLVDDKHASRSISGKASSPIQKPEEVATELREPEYSMLSGDGDVEECCHDFFRKIRNTDYNGLWPAGAMRCECHGRVISVRGTDMPPVGRGDGGRV
jgi:hypothetical protein